MILRQLLNLSDYTVQKLESFTQSNYFILKTVLILSVWAVLTSLPPYDLFNPSVWELMEYRSAHLFDPLPREYINSHTDKYAFRFIAPLLGRILHLNAFGFVVFHFVSGALLIGFFLSFLNSLNFDKATVFLLGLAFSSIFMGKVGFYDLFAHFDALALLFLVLSAQSRNLVLILVFSLMGFFTDERALISSCLLFGYFITDPDKKSGINRSIALVGGWVVYFVFRYFLSVYFHLKTGTQSIGLEVIFFNYKFAPLVLLLALEGFWILISIYLFYLIHQRHYTLLAFYVGGLLLIFGVALMVYDVSRSTSYLLVCLLIPLRFLSTNFTKTEVNRIALVIALFCVLIPTMEFFYEVYWLGPIFPKILKFL